MPSRGTPAAVLRDHAGRSPADQAFQISNALIELSSLARDEAGIVMADSEVVPPGCVIERPVLIEPDCERATFSVSWKDPLDDVVLEFGVSRRPKDHA